MFVNRASRVRFDVAVQTSNSYTFNPPITERSQHGDTALPLLTPKTETEPNRQRSRPPEGESKFQAVILKRLESERDIDLEAAKAYWIAAMLSDDKAS